MSHRITLISGDGIGEEITQSMQAVVKAAGVKVDWDVQLAGLKAMEKLGVGLPEETLKSIQKNQIAIKGPTTTPVGGGHKSSNVLLRQALQLYACVRPVKSIPGLKTLHDDVDLIIVRENTEGLYSGQEVQIKPGTVISLKLVTEEATKHVTNFAMDMACRLGRKKVTVGHKANIMKLGDGLFLKTAFEAAKSCKEIKIDDCIVDALCMKLVMNPSEFDVLLLENLYGDILSDLCAGLVGGLGLIPGANLGDKAAVFEAVHGSAPDIAGQDKANPTAMIKSSIMMLEHLGETKAAQHIERALHAALIKPENRTGDLGGKASSSQFTEAVIKNL